MRYMLCFWLDLISDNVGVPRWMDGERALMWDASFFIGNANAGKVVEIHDLWIEASSMATWLCRLRAT